MFEWLHHTIDTERWSYAVDCTLTLYCIQVTPSSEVSSPVSDSVHNVASQQQSNEYEN
jgi:hypothetical protein